MTGLWVTWIVLCGLIGLAIGKARHQGPVKCFLAGALLGPIGWLLIVISKPDESKTRQCPSCAERVLPEAKVCKHCGRDMPARVAAG